MNQIKSFLAFTYKNLLFILLILVTIASGVLYWLQQEETSVEQTNPEYHFYFIGQNSVDPVWKEVRQGIESAAKEYNVAVEFNSPRFNNPQEELKYLDIAVLSKVDGIITHAANGGQFRELINRAYSKDIPVVTIETDDNNSDRSTFVGTNSFLLGQEAAKLMIKAINGEANIAIIVSNDIEVDALSENLKLNGFLSTIKEYPNMQIIKIFTSKMGILSAEEITQTIISSYPEVDAILTTNSVDTLGAVQVIIDQNQVGNITLIGYGDTESILRYIRNGIIYGTVMSDPYRMGYESLKTLVDIKKDNNASTFIDTGVKIITKENLNEFENKIR